MRTSAPTTPEPAFAMRGIEVSPLVDADDTASAWEAVHQRVAPGGGSPLHTLGVDKLFVVLEGELVFTIDGAEHAGTTGATATVAAGVPHCFRNRSDAPAVVLAVTSGGGHVDFLEGMARLGADGPPPADALRSHAAAHHVELLA